MSFLKGIVEIISHIQKPHNNWIFFRSFGGQYNDNPKAISIELHEQHPEYKQFWAISNKSQSNDIPDYVNIVNANSYKQIIIKNKCKYVVENGAGYYLCYSPLKISIKRKLKNKKQIDIATWHGYPIKSIGKKMPENSNWEKYGVISTSDYFLSSGTQFTKIFDEGFLGNLNIVETGSPRNDILFSDNKELKKEIKIKLGLPLEKKVVLYAPTFRLSVQDSGIEQMQSIDFEYLFKELNTKFGGDWIFVFRAHNLVLLEIKKKYPNLFNEKVISGNKYDDMADYCVAADCFITDYSGCIFDIMLTEKPCFLYAHDRKNYEDKERGIQTDLNTLPYSFSNNFEELIANIRGFDDDECNKNRILFLESIGCKEDGHASKRVVNIIANGERNESLKKD